MGTSTTPWDAGAMRAEVEAVALIRDAISNREQVCAYTKGHGIRFCPHALGWRGEEAYVLGLILLPRRERVVDGADWEWLMEWQWIRLVDLHIPFAQKGDWVTCPRAQRPSAAEFLSRVYAEAE